MTNDPTTDAHPRPVRDPRLVPRPTRRADAALIRRQFAISEPEE